ncbi:MAG: methylaspartate ammonia-lyase [Verrucomicrobiae bacterium]|nr:methylaspartate ammonia-lyase [Verrucomicrobiae bacterium]
MKIQQVLFAPGKSAFFFDDQRAIKSHAIHDGFIYKGRPRTPGFRRIRMAGESVSVMLFLDDGQVALGDCAAVQYSGVGGRDPLFLANTYLPFLRRKVAPLLEGQKITSFRSMTNWMESLRFRDNRLHTAIRYGLSQAILDACAKARRMLPCEIIAEEYNLPLIPCRVPIFGQSGDNRYENVDKMILKEVDALPHGLINDIPDKLGRRGEKLRAYIRWIRQRIRQLRPHPSYRPALHLDVYGTIGIAFEGNVGKIADYIASLESDAGEFPLYIEGPVDMEEKSRQMETLLQIRTILRRKGSTVKIVADEWCNTLQDIREFTDAAVCDMIQIKTPDLGGLQDTVEAVLYCRAHGIEAYQGGTCNETDISARACVQVAIATRPHRLLAKPGMGFDEGFSIVNNEMERTLAILKQRKPAPPKTT